VRTATLIGSSAAVASASSTSGVSVRLDQRRSIHWRVESEEAPRPESADFVLSLSLVDAHALCRVFENSHL
jgi:hypothetical protein